MILSFQDIKRLKSDKIPVNLCQEIYDYQMITRKLPEMNSQTPLLHQILLQCGYMISIYPEFIEAVFKKAKIQKFGLNEFSRLFEFLLITDQHPLVQRMDIQSICKFLDTNIQQQQQCSNPRTWNANQIFTYIYKTYGPQNIRDVLFNITLPQGFYSPQRFISIVTEAVFSLQQIKCFCSICSQKQHIYTPFAYLESDKYNDTVQLNWVVGLYQLIQLVCENLVSLYQKQIQHQNSQQNLIQVGQITASHCFYLQIPQIQQMVDVLITRIPELQQFKDKTHEPTIISQSSQQQLIQQLTNAQFLFKHKVFLQVLIDLCEKYPQIINQIFITQQNQKFNPTIHMPEEFATTLCQLKQTPLVRALISQCLYRNWNKQGRTKVNTEIIEQLINQQPDAIVFTLVTIYYNQPSLLGKIIDTLCEQKLLFQALHSDYLGFSIDLALLAAGRQLINISLFLSGGLLRNGIAFYEAMCLTVIKKGINVLIQQNSNSNDQFIQQVYEMFDLPSNQGCQVQQLQNALELARQKQHVVANTYEFQLFLTSESVFSESIAAVLYRFIAVSGKEYFQYFLKPDELLMQRVEMLQNISLKIIKKVYPRVQLQFCYELSLTETKGAKRIDLSNLEIDEICDILDDKFKSSSLQDRCSYNVTVYSLIKESQLQNGHIDNWMVLLNMLAKGQLQDIFQQLVINKLCQKFSQNQEQYFLPIIQSHLKILQQKDTFKALNNILDWVSFYQMIQTTFGVTVGIIRPSSQIYSLEQNRKVIESGGSQSTSSQIEQLSNNSVEIAQINTFDNEIKQKFNLKQFKYYTVQPQSYETYKDTFNKILDSNDKECERLVLEQQQYWSSNQNKVKLPFTGNQTTVFISQFVTTYLLPTTDVQKESRAIYAIVNIFPQSFYPIIAKYAFYTAIRLLYVRQGIQLQLSAKVERRKIIQSLGHLIGCISKQLINIFDQNFINLDTLFEITRQSGTIIILSSFIQSIIEKAECSVLLGLFVYLLNKLNDLSQESISYVSTLEEGEFLQQDIEFIQNKLTGYFNGNYINPLQNTSGIVGLDDVHNCQLNEQLETVDKINLQLKDQIFYDQSQQYDLKDNITYQIINKILIQNQQLQENLRILAIQSRYVPSIKRIAENTFQFIKQLTFNQIKHMFQDNINLQDEIQKEMFTKLGQKQIQTIIQAKLIKPVSELIYQQILEMVTYPKTVNVSLVECVLKHLSINAADLTIKHIVQMQNKQLNLFTQTQQNSGQKYNFKEKINDEDDFLTTEASDVQIEFESGQKETENVLENVQKIINQFKNIELIEQQSEENDPIIYQQIQEEKTLQYTKQLLDLLHHKRNNFTILDTMQKKYDNLLECLQSSSDFLKQHLGNCIISYFLNFITCKADPTIKYNYDAQQKKIVMINPQNDDQVLASQWKKCQSELTQQFKQQFEQFNINIKPSHSTNYYNKQVLIKLFNFIKQTTKYINIDNYESQLDECISNSFDACLQSDIILSSLTSEKSTSVFQPAQYNLCLLLHLKWIISDEKTDLMQNYIQGILEKKIKQLLTQVNKQNISVSQYNQLSYTVNSIAQFCYQQVYSQYGDPFSSDVQQCQYLNKLIAENYTYHMMQHIDVPMYTQVYSYTLMSQIRKYTKVINEQNQSLKHTQFVFTNITFLIQQLIYLQIKNEIKIDLINYVIKINNFELDAITVDQLLYSLISMKVDQISKCKQQTNQNEYVNIFIQLIICIINFQQEKSIEILSTCLNRIYTAYFIFGNAFILQADKQKILATSKGYDQQNMEITYKNIETENDVYKQAIEELILFIYKELIDYFNMRQQIQVSDNIDKLSSLILKSLQLYLPQKHPQFINNLLSIISSPDTICLGTYPYNINYHLILTKWWLTEYDNDCWNNYSILLQNLLIYCQKDRQQIQHLIRLIKMLSNNQQSSYFLLKYHFVLYKSIDSRYNLIKRSIIPQSQQKLNVSDLSLLQSSPLTDWKIDMKGQEIKEDMHSKENMNVLPQTYPKDYAIWFLERVIEVSKKGYKLTTQQLFIDFKYIMNKQSQQIQYEILSCIGSFITGYNLETFAALTIMSCCERQNMCSDIIQRINMEIAVE